MNTVFVFSVIPLMVCVSCYQSEALSNDRLLLHILSIKSGVLELSSRPLKFTKQFKLVGCRTGLASQVVCLYRTGGRRNTWIHVCDTSGVRTRFDSMRSVQNRT
jgi:hypothetical protein